MRILKLESSDEFLCLLEHVKGLSHGSNTFYVMKKQVENRFIFQAIGQDLLFECSTEATPRELENHIRSYGFMIFKGEGFFQ